MIQHTHAKPWVPSLRMEPSGDWKAQDDSRLRGLVREWLFLLQNLGRWHPFVLSFKTQ